MPPPQRKRKEPTGKLRVLLPHGYRGGRARWTDGPTSLNGSLDRVFDTLEQRVIEDDKAAIERQRRMEELEREQQRREELARLHRIDDARFKRSRRNEGVVLADTENGDDGATEDGDEGGERKNEIRVRGTNDRTTKGSAETRKLRRNERDRPPAREGGRRSPRRAGRLPPWTWMMVAPAAGLSRSLRCPFPRFAR